jgi:hypothetical protein
MISRTSTKQEILDIQARQLAEWKYVLKPAVFKQLKKRVLRDNDTTEDPYKLFRGGSMDCWVSNACIRLSNGVNVEDLNDGDTHPDYSY